MSLNKIILQGRLGADPELKHTQSNLEVCSVNIAVDRDTKTDSGERQADWVSIVAWRATAKFLAGYFHKGDPILIEGRLQTRAYTDKNGNNRTATEVVANQIYFCGGRRESGAPAQTGAANYGAADYGTPGADQFAELADDDGELPF